MMMTGAIHVIFWYMYHSNSPRHHISSYFASRYRTSDSVMMSSSRSREAARLVFNVCFPPFVLRVILTYGTVRPYCVVRHISQYEIIRVKRLSRQSLNMVRCDTWNKSDLPLDLRFIFWRRNAIRRRRYEQVRVSVTRRDAADSLKRRYSQLLPRRVLCI